MALSLDTSAITHGIQLAVAPVFLLTAVSGMIGAVAGRLARIIDRARVVEDRARVNTEPEFLLLIFRHLKTLLRLMPYFLRTLNPRPVFMKSANWLHLNI